MSVNNLPVEVRQDHFHGTGFLRPAFVPVNSPVPWHACRESRWNGVVACPNGDLYGAPHDAGSLLKFRADIKQVTYTNVPYLFTRAPLEGLAIGLDGKFYFPPIVVQDGALPFPAFINALRSGVNSEDAYHAFMRERRQAERGCVCLSFDPEQESFSVSWHEYVDDAGLANSCENGGFGGIARANNGKLYCPPLNLGSVAVVDPVHKQLTFIRLAKNAFQRNKWSGIALATDGQLYCAPLRARSVLVINPVNDTLYNICDNNVFDNCGAGIYQVQDGEGEWFDIPDDLADNVHCWSGIAMADNGKLYCSPQDSNAVLVIDIETQVLSYIKLRASGMNFEGLTNKWSGITFAEDGRLYCAPSCVDCLLVIDPRYATLALVPVRPIWDIAAEHATCQRSTQLHCNINFAWCGIVTSNGRVWCVPDREEQMLTLLLPRPDLSSLLRLDCNFDLVLKADDGAEIQCHSSVIASASKVFRAMLSTKFREGQDGKIVLQGVSSTTVRCFVGYAYSGRFDYSGRCDYGPGAVVNMQELTGLAHRYELDHLLAHCLQVYLRDLNEHNISGTSMILNTYRNASFETSDIWDSFKEIVFYHKHLVSAAIEVLANSQQSSWQ